jgi:AraC-like DNA-binding protein
MNRLDRIQNWLELAEQSGWCVIVLAKQCQVSARTLERYFNKKIGQSPKTWLAERRQRRAAEILNLQLPVKEAAFQLGYKYSAHFTRDFKRHWGCCPSTWAVSPIESQSRSQKTQRSQNAHE